MEMLLISFAAAWILHGFVAGRRTDYRNPDNSYQREIVARRASEPQHRRSGPDMRYAVGWSAHQLRHGWPQMASDVKRGWGDAKQAYEDWRTGNGGTGRDTDRSGTPQRPRFTDAWRRGWKGAHRKLPPAWWKQQASDQPNGTSPGAAAGESAQATDAASREAEIRRHVAAQFAADNVREDEVVLMDNGDVVIDRRSTKPWAKPIKVGTWKKQPTDSTSSIPFNTAPNGATPMTAPTGEATGITPYRTHLQSTIAFAQQRLEAAAAEIQLAEQEIASHDNVNAELASSGMGSQTTGEMAALIEAAMARKAAAEDKLAAAEAEKARAEKALSDLDTQGHTTVEEAVKGASAPVASTSFYEN